jgi:hypothetical protein
MSTGRISEHAVNAYLGAVDWLIAVLGRDEVFAAWSKPSAIRSYTVGGVAAHAVQGVQWLEQLLREPEPKGLRAVSLEEFFGPNRVDNAGDDDRLAKNLISAAEGLALAGPRAVIVACATSREALPALLRAAPSDRAVPVFRVVGGQVPLHVYLRTRVLEAVVHGDDVASSALGMRVVPEPPAASLGLSLDVCVELARSQVGDMDALRAFTRAERALPDALRVL